jgi:hypothetical protein
MERMNGENEWRMNGENECREWRVELERMRIEWY